MQDETRIPKTARDALLIELIGDLGTVHDMIKALPNDINQAAAESLELIAKSVEEAEITASNLAVGIEQKKNNIVADLRKTVQETLEQQAKNTLLDLEEDVTRLRKKIASLELADPKSRRLNFILSFSIIIILLFSGAAIYGIYNGAKSTINDLNTIISLQDKIKS